MEGAAPPRGLQLRPKLVRAEVRPRLRAQIERDGPSVFLAVQDANGSRATLKISLRGAQAIGALVTDAATATEEEPSYEIEVVGELEQQNRRK